MVNELATGFYRVAVPIPGPLKTVNCYLLRGRTGWTLVDCGFHDAGAEAAWRDAFAALGIQPTDLEQILVTHYHPDHFGAAGWLQQLSGAPVRMFDRELPMVELFWHRQRGQAEAIAALFARHGLPADLLADLELHHRQAQDLVSPIPRITPFTASDTLRLGDRAFRPIWTPGHSDGLAVFWCEADRLLLADDMVLAGISPNISLMPGCDPDPLGRFLASLDRVARLPARMTYTGHRAEIPDLAGRCRELARHHAERLDRVMAMIRQAGPGGATGWEVCLDMFGRQPTIHNTRFAMAEALAHLEHLARQERLVREPGPVVRYRLP